MSEPQAAPSPTTIRLSTLAGCGLAIGRYPRFRYDGHGGGGLATVPGGAPCPTSGVEGPWPLLFDPATLRIPDLTWRTTRLLGLPIPPGVRIAIEPLELAGELEPGTGRISLRFRARFHCSLLDDYRPPALQVNTVLGSGAVLGQRHQAHGSPLAADGTALLAGIAEVPPSGDPWLDAFLGLPDEALALLRCRLEWPVTA